MLLVWGGSAALWARPCALLLYEQPILACTEIMLPVSPAMSSRSWLLYTCTCDLHVSHLSGLCHARLIQMMGLSTYVAVLCHVAIPVGCQLVVSPVPGSMLSQHSMGCLSLQPLIFNTRC